MLMQIVQKKKRNEEPISTVEKDSKKSGAEINGDKNPNSKQEQVPDPNLETKIAQLQALGFPREKSLQVLTNANGNV